MADTVSERPTMSAAFAADIAPATESLPVTSSPETEAPASPPAAATAPPASPESGEVPPQGVPPEQRWPDILANARTKARQEAIAELQQQYGWAEAIDPAEGQQLQRWAQAYRADPLKWFADTAQELKQAFPHLAANLHSEAARILAGAKGGGAPADFEPDIPVVDEQGRVVNHAYSADRMRAIVKHELALALGPVQQRFQQQDAEAEHTAALQQVNAEADRIFSTVSKLPHFAEHQAAIAEAMGRLTDVSPNEAALLAYVNVVLPNLSKAEQAKTLTDLKTKAAAATLNPSSAVVASTHKPTSLLDPSLTW